MNGAKPKAAVAGAGWRAARQTALVADAAGRPLSAGVPRVAGPGARLCRFLPHPRAGRRGDIAAGPALRHGCGDSVRRYPAGAAWRSGRSSVSARTDRCLSRSRTAGDAARLASGGDRLSARTGLRNDPAMPGCFAGRDRADRLCRAPWTVATYMVEGGGSRDFRRVKSWAYRDPEGFQCAASICSSRRRSPISRCRSRPAPRSCSCSTAGPACCRRTGLQRWVIEPTRRIVRRLKSAFPRCR